MKPNQDLRDLLQEKRIYRWELAKEIGIHEKTLIGWLRDEPMPIERQIKFFDAIDKIEEARK